MKILLFGKDGRLGTELQRSLATLGKVVALNRGSADLCGDLAKPTAIYESVISVAPQVIVNAAAWTDVEKAEDSPEVARKINVLAPAAMAEAAARLGARLVHYSTDYVFDGSGSEPWTEEDSPHPLNSYGAGKFEGEVKVATTCPDHLIFRTSWLYSSKRHGFAQHVLSQAMGQMNIAVVNDQIGSPTGADWLADMTAHALRVIQSGQMGLAGVYHLAASGFISRHGYARFLLECAQREGWKLKSVAEAVQAVSSNDYPSAVKRPQNARLDTSKFEAAFGCSCPPWQDGVKGFVRNLK